MRCGNHEHIVHIALCANEVRRSKIVLVCCSGINGRISSIPNAIKSGFEPGKMPNPAFHARHNQTLLGCTFANLNCRAG